MTIALNQPPPADLRRTGVIGPDYQPTMMEIIATEDKPKPHPPYSGPAPPMHRIPHSEGSHGPPGPPGLYDHSWRQYPSTIDSHPPEQRRTSNAPQPSLSSHAYPAIQNRELPQLPPDGPYGRPGSLPAPAHTPSDPPPPHANYHHMNGASHEPTPHSAPPEYRPRMSFPPPESHSNGDPPPPPLSLPPAQYPTSVPQGSHTPAPYESNYYQSPAYGIRQRKAARAQQACDQCRARKAKCDEGRPACSHCKENSLICIYKEVPPHKQEKATQLLLDRMQQLEDRLEDRLSQFQTIQVEQSLLLGRLSAEAKLKETGSVPSSKEVQKQPGYLFSKPVIIEAPQEPETKDAIPSTNGQKTEGNTSLEQLLQTGEDGELSIPIEHTTAAHKLLGWAAVRALIQPYHYDDDYVMKIEEERGLIRVYGRGEGDESSQAKSSSQNGLNPNWEERYSYSTSPGSSWNLVTNGNDNKPDSLEVRGINDAGQLCIDGDTVRRYYATYMEHIHKLHPFLDQADVKVKMENFIKLYCPDTSSAPIPNSNHLTDVPRGAKRKRSCDNFQRVGSNMQSPTAIKTEHAGNQEIERSIDNAIVLLIIALGRICEVRHEPIRGPVTDHPVDFRNEYIPGPISHLAKSPDRSDIIIPPQGSYSAHQSRSFSSPSMPDQHRDNQHLKNTDTVPGLIYYGYATNILGNLQGANRLPHVHAALLAGLYTGQLAHPFQSHGWIYQAARACQVLVRTKPYEKMEDSHVKDLYNFAYWTCLQLESDILAELDLPASGISRSEARISLPKGRFTISLPNDISAPSTIMMFFYSAQIHLRKVLNRIHTDLYKVDKKRESRWTSGVQEILSMNLELWRHSLPEVMKWKDTDPPSTDINVARMRAKYYGARYIIHRPVLWSVLHFPVHDSRVAVPVDSPTGSAAMSGSKSQQLSPSLTHNQHAPGMMRMSSDLGATSRISAPANQATPAFTAYRDLPTKLRRACKVCVESAVLSTEAFDGIQGRPIVTNIFGTAHAQFGNMLVLSTTYMSHLSELVDRNDLERLLKRTIYFLLQSQNISPSLRADAKILTQIYEKIFGENPGSFTSQP